MTFPLHQDVDVIALAGDWHGNRMFARTAIRYAAEHGAEGILHLGDFGFWQGPAGILYLDVIQDALDEKGLWCAFVDGNHENHWLLNDIPLDDSMARNIRPSLWHLPRGYRWTWHGKIWLALGGATSLDRGSRKLGVDWWPEEAITQGQAMAVTSAGPADFMITHDCPSGVDIPGLHNHWRPGALTEALKHRLLLKSIVEIIQPSRLWHGHFHVRHTAEVEFAGKPCIVMGLNCDDTYVRENIEIADVKALSAPLIPSPRRSAESVSEERHAEA